MGVKGQCTMGWLMKELGSVHCTVQPKPGTADFFTISAGDPKVDVS